MTDNALRNGAAIAAIGVVGALITGLIYVSHPDTPGAQCSSHVVASRPGKPEANSLCMLVTVQGPSESWSLFHLCDEAGNPGYAIARLCGPSVPGEAVALPPGITELPESESEVPYLPGYPELEVWGLNDPNVPLNCACSSGTDCRKLVNGQWLDEPKRARPVTLEAGQWQGAGCLRKPCWEWSGINYLPTGCRP